MDAQTSTVYGVTLAATQLNNPNPTRRLCVESVAYLDT